MARLRDMREVADYIKQQVDISKVVGEIVHLDRASGDLLKGLCCFHEEKTPSLTVTPSKGLYHCFGCKASGDIISFYKEQYNMGTTEAVRAIAKKYNVDISRFERELTEDEIRQEDLMALNERIAQYMHTNLMDKYSHNRGWMWMTEERGIEEETIKEFGIGYSPDLSHLLGMVDGTSDQDLTDLGILDKSGYKEAMWADSVVYPLYNAYGKVMGFKTRPHWEGRITDDKGRKYPKFLGTSSQSALHDDTILYGFHIARKHIKNGRLIAVEGQHDVLSAHQADIKNVTGTDGTALNKQKMSTLEEFGVRELVIVYDGDDAGREASLKVAKQVTELETSISVKIASMPDGHDPDEYIAQYGRLAFLQVVHESVYASQYIIDQVASTIRTDNVTGKIDFIKQVQPIILKAPSYEQSFLVAYVAEKIKIDHAVIEDMMRAEQARTAKSLLYNIEGERIVLGGMLRDENFRTDLILEMRKDDWYLPKHQLVFDMVRDMDENSVPISIETVKSTMNNRELNQVFNEGAIIDELYSTVGDHKTIKDDLVDKSIRRKLIKQADNLKRNAHDLKQRTVLLSEEHLEGVQKVTDSSNHSTMMDAKSGAKGLMDTLHERMNTPDQIVGIDLGPRFRTFTRMINGVQKKKLITISANQSVGKTTILANFLDEVGVTQKLPWAHFTLEMPNEEMVQKIVGIRSGVNTQSIERGNVTTEEYNRVRQATIEYHEGGLIMIDDVTTLEGIINQTRKLIRSHGIVGISIDYIQLMSIERRGNFKKYEEEGQISGALKNDVAKGLNIPVIMLSQMSRRALDRDVQKAEDGQGAYKIAQDSDIYAILQEKSEEEVQQYGVENGNMIFNLDKNRGGRGDVLIDLFFDRPVQRMQEVN